MIKNILNEFCKGTIHFCTEQTYKRIITICIIVLLIIFGYNILYKEEIQEQFENCTTTVLAETMALSKQNSYKLKDIDNRLKSIETELIKAKGETQALDNSIDVDTSEMPSPEELSGLL